MKYFLWGAHFELCVQGAFKKMAKVGILSQKVPKLCEFFIWRLPSGLLHNSCFWNLNILHWIESAISISLVLCSPRYFPLTFSAQRALAAKNSLPRLKWAKVITKSILLWFWKRLQIEILKYISIFNNTSIWYLTSPIAEFSYLSLLKEMRLFEFYLKTFWTPEGLSGPAITGERFASLQVFVLLKIFLLLILGFYLLRNSIFLIERSTFLKRWQWLKNCFKRIQATVR